MRKFVVIAIVVAVVGGAALYFGAFSSNGDAAAASGPQAGGPGGGGQGGQAGRGNRGAQGGGGGFGGPGGGPGGPGGGGGPRVPMTVELGTLKRGKVAAYLTVVGNLIGETTVDVVPRVSGRLDSVQVQLGDRVARGQQVAKVEDRELREQVNQSEANIEVNRATVTARQNDQQVAASALDRAKASFERGLISQQALEDAEARFNAAASQVSVAKAQLTSTQARLDELKINLANTVLVAPMDGVVSKRNLDPGAFAGTNTAVVSLVDIGTVRLIANLVEKDFKRIQVGGQAMVEVDAFPGEQFVGRVSRVAPVFDPATRTATMEIQIPNPGFRLKPGMYARVRLLADRKQNALVVPRNAIVDISGRRGIYTVEGDVAHFQAVQTGLSDGDFIEVTEGVQDGMRLVTVGALALRDGDRISVIGAGARGNGRANGAARGGRGSSNGQTEPSGQKPAGS
jgi:RND family efflux transporter MFP subunit